jgi:hypothetical protein
MSTALTAVVPWAYARVCSLGHLTGIGAHGAR